MVYSNFYETYWYTPQSERESPKPASFLLQQPSYKLYTAIGKSEELPEGFLKESVDHLLLEHCVVGAMNVDGYESPLDLPIVIQQDLLTTILELFYPTEEFLKELSFNLDASIDDKFSNDTWNCDNCQKRRLNRQRNCPFLDPKEFHSPAFTLTIGEQVFTQCPMNTRNYKLIGTAFEGYKLAESSFLPTIGGYGEQPLMFCILSQRVKEKVNFYERKQMEERRAN